MNSDLSRLGERKRRAIADIDIQRKYLAQSLHGLPLTSDILFMSLRQSIVVGVGARPFLKVTAVLGSILVWQRLVFRLRGPISIIRLLLQVWSVGRSLAMLYR